MKKKKAFTLIELIAVLVILAILALIVTPLVMSIIKKSKDAANKRSIDGYGHAVDLAIATYRLEHGKKANKFEDLEINYKGSNVVCDEKILYKDNFFLSKCSIDGKEVKDSKNSDGYYHYGNLSKIGIAYGKSVERAIKRYIKDNNTVPNSISLLDVNMPNLNINCNVFKANQDGTAYLNDCNINDVDILFDGDNKKWGKIKYFIGEKVKYNEIEFYVISDSKDNYVSLLKSTPLTVDEVNTYGEGHINMNVASYYSYKQHAYNSNGYGGVVYYSRETCGYDSNNNYSSLDCNNDYELSDIKYVVDNWMSDNIKSEDLIEDLYGYKGRLIKKEELIDLGYEYYNNGSIVELRHTDIIPSWINSPNYAYWTMSPREDSDTSLYFVNSSGGVGTNGIGCEFLIRPVINVKLESLNC